jgi:hypothetical protein
LHGLCDENAEIRKLLQDAYVSVMIDIASPNAEELLKKCQAALATDERDKGVGFPFLAVLDGNAKIVTAQRTEPLEEGRAHNPTRVKDFLGRWVAPRNNAGSKKEP